MPNVVTTSIVVQFSTGSEDGVLTVEVDDRDAAQGGLNGGKTSFVPGDTVFLLLYKSSNVTLQAALASIGSLSAGQQVTISKTEDVTFAGETEASVRYPVLPGSLSYQWIGASLGAVSVISENKVRIPAPPANSYPVGIARVTYDTRATAYRLQHSDPGLSEYGIVAFFAGATT